MNIIKTPRQFLLVSSVSVLLTLPVYAEEKMGSSASTFPPSDFSVEKNTAEQMATKHTATQADAASAPVPVAQNSNPWRPAGTAPIAQKVEKQYPPVVNNTVLAPVPPATNVPMAGNKNVSPFVYRRPVNVFQQPYFQAPPMSGNFPPVALPPRNMGYQMPNTNFSNISPFGNSFSPNSFFNNGTLPTPWSNVGGMNPWRNGNNSALPPFLPNVNADRKKAWGDVRHIWPDFYTDFTDEAWDKSINAPYDMGRMPGGWRAPSLSSPDPVTVGDAVTNQFPPMLEEMGNMMNFAN